MTPGDSIAGMGRSRRAIAVITIVVALVTAACGGGISADDCGDITDETIALLQELLDDVDAESAGRSLEEFVDAEGDLPSLERFERDAATIDELAAQLGCTQAEISRAVEARLGELSTQTELGRFIVDAIRTGGL